MPYDTFIYLGDLCMALPGIYQQKHPSNGWEDQHPHAADTGITNTVTSMSVLRTVLKVHFVQQLNLLCWRCSSGAVAELVHLSFHDCFLNKAQR
jgi:hypothetical protein